MVPEKKAWMTQAQGLCNQKAGERSRQREKKARDRMSWEREGEGEADMQATEERGNTPTSVT